jgi:hypothetical protein
VYKAQEEPGPEKRAILDTLNGIVMIGENALRQLHDTIQRKENQRRQKSEEYAAHIYDIGKWIGEYCKQDDTNLVSNGKTWRYLDKLFEFLKAGEEHTSGTLKDLIEGLAKRQPDAIFDRDLPLLLLQHSCYRQTVEKIPMRPELTDIPSASISERLTRMNAFRVVHCCNIAAALDIRRRWMNVVTKIVPPEEERPTLLVFLDVLHPTHSRCDWRSLKRISLSCDGFLDVNKLRESINESLDLRNSSDRALMELPQIIVTSGRIANPTFPTPSNDWDPKSAGQVVIPRFLCVLVKDSQYMHWIPDLYHVARHWENSNNDTAELSPRTSAKRAYEQAFKNIQNTKLASGVNPVDALGYNVIEIIDDTVEDRKRRMTQLYIHFKKPHYTWVLRQSKERSTHEFHTDKKADRPRKHRGYFVSVDDVPGDGRRWDYITDPPTWELKMGSDPFPGIQHEVQTFGRDKSEFEDFFNNFLPSHNPVNFIGKKGDTEFWELPLGQNRFSIESTDGEYILTEKSEELDDLVPHTPTQQDDSTQIDSLVQRSEKEQVQTLHSDTALDETERNAVPQTGDVREGRFADSHNDTNSRATSGE